MLELYQAYADYEDMMQLIEDLVTDVVSEVAGTLDLRYDGPVINLARPWPRLSFGEALDKYAGVDMDTVADDRLRELVNATGREDAAVLLTAEAKNRLPKRKVSHFAVSSNSSPSCDGNGYAIVLTPM